MKLYLFDREVTKDYLVRYVKSYAEITKYSYERLERTLKYSVKGISIKQLLYEALYKKED